MPTKHPSVEVAIRGSTHKHLGARVEACGFSTTSEYLRALVRKDLEDRVIREREEVNPRTSGSRDVKVVHVSMTRGMCGALNRRCDELGAPRQGDYVADLVERDIRGRNLLLSLEEAETRRRRAARGLRRDAPSRPGATRRLGTSKAGGARLELALEVLFFAALLGLTFVL